LTESIAGELTDVVSDVDKVSFRILQCIPIIAGANVAGGFGCIPRFGFTSVG
jgi:hypothetical protein